MKEQPYRHPVYLRAPARIAGVKAMPALTSMKNPAYKPPTPRKKRATVSRKKVKTAARAPRKRAKKKLPKLRLKFLWF